MKFHDRYTNPVLKAEDTKKTEEEKKETSKIELSNDAFALGELLELIMSKLHRIGNIK